jgi:hypothetical protein
MLVAAAVQLEASSFHLGQQLELVDLVEVEEGNGL